MFPITIIEIELDGSGRERDRRPAWSFETRKEAIQMMQNLISSHTESGYAEDGSVWWGTAVDGSRMVYLVESSAGGH